MKKCIAMLLSLLLLAGLCGTAFAELEPTGLPEIYPLTVDKEIVAQAKPAPEACFTSFASENGLEGTLCYLVGKVIRTEETGPEDAVFQTFILQTEYGYAMVADFYTYLMDNNPPAETKSAEEPNSDYSFPEIDEFVKVVAFYFGYSDVEEMPIFYYGAPKVLQDFYAAEVEDTRKHTPTTGESNALRSANDYLNYSAFSYEGLIRQLEFEGYTHEQATYGADNCGADWFQQAAKSAEEYLDYSAFSRDGLIRQLEYEGFTHEQAVYGAEQNGL